MVVKIHHAVLSKYSYIQRFCRFDAPCTGLRGCLTESLDLGPSTTKNKSPKQDREFWPIQTHQRD
jgi:hypothetical protein